MRGKNGCNDFQDFSLKNGASQGQNLALTGPGHVWANTAEKSPDKLVSQDVSIHSFGKSTPQQIH